MWLLDKAKDKINRLTNAIFNRFNNLKQTIKHKADEFVNGAVSCFNSFKRKVKECFNRFGQWLVDTRFPVVIDLLKWLIIDICRFFKHGKRIHLYGIWCFVGIYGGGKTISLVHYLEQMRLKYGDKIYISSNFFYKHQDFPITHWKDIAKDYDKPVIFAYDELQNEFNSRDYRNFPIPLVHELTQNRKGLGKQIVYTTQNFETVDKNFRDLTTHIVRCRTFFTRLTYCRYFKHDDYQDLMSTVNVEKKFKFKPFKNVTFVQSDYLRNLYDSFKRLDSIRKMEFNDRHSA